MSEGMTPLGEVIMAVLAGAFLASEGKPYRPLYPPRFKQCSEQVWPLSGSKLGRLVAALRQPRALVWLEDHLQRTLTPQTSHTLRIMPYEEFLGTKYWWIVKGILVTTRGRRCEDCHNFDILDAHHLTYEHRGAEVFHLEDLRLLCRECHSRRHGE